MAYSVIAEREEKSEDEPPNPNKSNRNVSLEEIAEISGMSIDEIKSIGKIYPVKISRHYFSLIKERGDGIYRQCIPSEEEILDVFGEEDPLNEEEGIQKGIPPLITHRYPDRVLFRISNSCSMYCRFCTRKRKVGDPTKQPTWKEIDKALSYIENHSEVRDVILSGGDPLMLSNKNLERIIRQTREIPHIEIIRIGTRVPCTLPERVDEELCDMLKKYHPLYINTHFNHPDEITPESEKACNMLADAGIPLGSQTVLLKGVNDNPETMKKLMQGLLKMRVRPYYIYQCDPVKGANHFRTRVEKGLEIYKTLRGHTSGLGVPQFVIDAPGGGGKIPLLPKYVKSITDERVVMENYKNEKYEYIQVD